jgi:hypothetical protein
MLRKITAGNDSSDPEHGKEIFIERDGERFKFILDCMRNDKVSLALSISRSQFMSDMEYYGIHFNESKIHPIWLIRTTYFIKFQNFFIIREGLKTFLNPNENRLSFVIDS